MSLRGHGKEICRCVIAMAEATLAKTETKLKELRKLKESLSGRRVLARTLQTVASAIRHRTFNNLNRAERAILLVGTGAQRLNTQPVRA
jgi:hypothetical protein